VGDDGRRSEFCASSTNDGVETNVENSLKQGEDDVWTLPRTEVEFFKTKEWNEMRRGGFDWLDLAGCREARRDSPAWHVGHPNGTRERNKRPPPKQNDKKGMKK